MRPLPLALLALVARSAIPTGPDIGAGVPDFSAPDQTGKVQTLKSVLGPKGALLVFFRSADWWPYCKTQLVELERDYSMVRKRGLGLAAISYDSVAVLKNFADRKNITFPLLSDTDSRIIRAFGILNTAVKPDTAQYGIPHPGTYLLDSKGRVVAKYFEEEMRERITASAILAGRLGAPATAAGTSVRAKHAALTTTASTAVAMPGHRVVLAVEIDLPTHMHVYAPGVEGYIPVAWEMEPAGGTKVYPVQFPGPEKLYLKAIKETALIYRRKVRLTREITFGQEPALKPLLTRAGEVVLTGALRYQACDDRECYTPETVPLEWRFQFQPLERERVPAPLQSRQR